MSFQNFFVEFL